MSADKESIWDTLLIVFSGFDGWFCVLSGFLDETFKHDGEHLTGVGGFLFREEELSEVQRKLAPLGPPRSISKERYYGNHEKIEAIAKIVADHRGEGFVCTVLDDDFAAWKAANPNNAEWLGKPYSICLLHLIDIIGKYLKYSNEEVLYFIESGANGEKEGQIIMNRIMENETLRPRFRLRNFIFISKNHDPDGIILRSADLLINEWQWNYRQQEIADQNGLPDPGWTKPIRLLFKDETSLPIRHFRITQGTLRSSALWVALQGLAL